LVPFLENFREFRLVIFFILILVLLIFVLLIFVFIFIVAVAVLLLPFLGDDLIILFIIVEESGLVRVGVKDDGVISCPSSPASKGGLPTLKGGFVHIPHGLLLIDVHWDHLSSKGLRHTRQERPGWRGCRKESGGRKYHDPSVRKGIWGSIRTIR